MATTKAARHRNRSDLQSDPRRVQRIGKKRCEERGKAGAPKFCSSSSCYCVDRDFESDAATWRLRYSSAEASIFFRQVAEEVGRPVRRIQRIPARRQFWWGGQVRAGSQMRTKEFLSRLEHDRIVGRFGKRNRKTSSQIRVTFSAAS